jgi:hypothetical protein
LSKICWSSVCILRNKRKPKRKWKAGQRETHVICIGSLMVSGYPTECATNFCPLAMGIGTPNELDINYTKTGYSFNHILLFIPIFHMLYCLNYITTDLSPIVERNFVKLMLVCFPFNIRLGTHTMVSHPRYKRDKYVINNVLLHGFLMSRFPNSEL